MVAMPVASPMLLGALGLDSSTLKVSSGSLTVSPLMVTVKGCVGQAERPVPMCCNAHFPGVSDKSAIQLR
jgi:hypothetical protein